MVLLYLLIIKELNALKLDELPKIKTETFILKFSRSKEQDNQFALIYDPIKRSSNQFELFKKYTWFRL